MAKTEITKILLKELSKYGPVYFDGDYYFNSGNFSASDTNFYEYSHKHNSNYLPASYYSSSSLLPDSDSGYYYDTVTEEMIYKNWDLMSRTQSNKPKHKFMNKLTSALKKILPSDIQKQYRAGFRDGELSLSEFGKEELLEILADKYKEELTERANETIKEEND